MKDIRILTGKQITPSFETVSALLGCKASAGKPEIKPLFDKLLPRVQMHLCPKAALTIAPFPSETPGLVPAGKMALYMMYTLGNSISRLIESCTAKGDMLSAMTIDAMADSCLFAFEKQLLPILCNICLEEGFGIEKRLSLPQDLPMETQKTAFSHLEAGRTLGLSLTSGFMLNPVKSMSLILELTRDTSKNAAGHDCQTCTNQDCLLRKTPEVCLLTTVDKDGCRKQMTCPKGSSLLEILQKHGIFMPACCGGMGTCGKCGVRIIKGLLPVTPEDQTFFSEAKLQEGMRLACRAVLRGDMTVSIPDSQQSKAAFTALKSSISFIKIPKDTAACSADDFGIAIDIGTTTLAFSLLHLQTGKILDSITAVNSQRIYGADIISRIQAANSGRQKLLQAAIQEDLVHGIRTLTEQNLSGRQRVQKICIAANTAMLHLLRNRSCSGFCSYPFRPKNLSLEELTFEEAFGKSFFPAEDAVVTLLPSCSAFIGADITAGLYACGCPLPKNPFLFIDLGTNGEMALWTGDRIYTASVAAGPAFEGGNIKWGTGSISGAIASVAIRNSAADCRTIGNAPPTGICGTGVLEAVSELAACGIIEKSGRLSEPYFKQGFPLAQTEDGRQITLTQQDIREIQMAKAAIRAGIEILFLHSGLRYEDVEQVYLAGGFGCFLDTKKTAAIGLFPKELLPKTTAAGNASLLGALKYLAEQDKTALETITALTEEITLAQEPAFQELYLSYMNF